MIRIRIAQAKAILAMIIVFIFSLVLLVMPAGDQRVLGGESAVNTPESSTELPDILWGDANGSGCVRVSDAILILRHVVGAINIAELYGSDALLRSRVSRHTGEIDVGDALLILRYTVGLISQFPVENPADLVTTMSLQEKIGQLMIVGFRSDYADSHVLNMIQNHHVGGVIFYKRNISSSTQLNMLTRQLQDENIGVLPLFLSIDQEGGRVSRLPDDAPKFPSAFSLGESGDEPAAFANGKAIGRALEERGLNTNFAPVLDIWSNPQNTVIGDRSFGTNPEIVSLMGTAVMQGLQAEGIISVVKHFPGHGDTELDSHYDLPVVYHNKSRLSDFELVPFRQAISNGANAIMTAHIVYPEIDPDGWPATMSKIILTGILREELNFNGVIITDDLEMAAIRNNFGVNEAAVKSILAGADILLVCHTPATQIGVYNYLLSAVEEGRISEERIDKSVERIIRLKLTIT